MTTTRLAVRCCCRPARIRGYLDVPAALAVPYGELRVPLGAAASATPPAELRFVVMPYQQLSIEDPADSPYIVTRIRDLALKGDDYVTDAQLRAIPGFVRALPDGSPADGRMPAPPERETRDMRTIESLAGLACPR
jgi:hypothetical protein